MYEKEMEEIEATSKRLTEKFRKDLIRERKDKIRYPLKRAFMELYLLVSGMNGYCSCQGHPCQKHVDDCPYVELLKRMENIRKLNKIDRNGAIFHEILGKKSPL